VRANPPFLVWTHDRDDLIERRSGFLGTAAALGVATVFVPFDDCGFGGAEPVHGPQPEPVPGGHNSRVVARPGRAAVMDQAQWPALEAYMKDLIGRLRDDPRVLMWDLFNEPGNRMILTETGDRDDDAALAGHSRDLMLASFDRVGSVAPAQPDPVGAWVVPPPGAAAPPIDNEIDALALANSDMITFHVFCDRATAAAIVDQLSRHGRPVLTTAWMDGARGGEPVWRPARPLLRPRRRPFQPGSCPAPHPDPPAVAAGGRDDRCRGSLVRSPAPRRFPAGRDTVRPHRDPVDHQPTGRRKRPGVGARD